MYRRINKTWLIFLVIAVSCMSIFLLINKISKEIEIRKDTTIKVLMPDQKIKKIQLEDYLVGVLAAEMPAEFETEALKAQAVAARTYVLKRKEENKTNNGYDVDTTEKTQAWCSNWEMYKKWGLKKYWQYKKKITEAVQDTRGEIMTYKGTKIDALFFSSCGRKPTEFSQDVWGTNIEYLAGVSSEEKNLQRFVTKQEFEVANFYKLLGLKDSTGNISKNDISIAQRTRVGRVEKVNIKGKTFTGQEFRTKLKLNSTDLEFAISGQKIIFTVYGKGHGVGMSQYGANDMAKDGKKFEQILKHYYTGIEISQM